MPQLSHWEGIKICAVAALADVAIVLVGYWSIAAITRSRRWFLAPGYIALGGFVGIGVLVAIAIERLALTTGRWLYSDAMPIIPIFDVGLSPILQWLILPLLALWFARRQIVAR
jgi:hypothetical protein